MFAMKIIALLVCSASISNVEATQLRLGTKTGVKARTPAEIKNVITLLENLQAELREKEEKEQATFDEFACECKKMGIDLLDELSGLKGKLPGLEADIKKGEELTDMLKKLIGDDRGAISADEDAMKRARFLHEREKKSFLETVADLETNIKALNKAIPALEQGMEPAAFLQTTEAATLSKLALKVEMTEENRDILTAFLNEDSDSGLGYDPKSGQIVGILKQMRDEMKAELRKLKIDEAYDTASFNELIDARQQHEQKMRDELNEYWKRLAEEALKMAQEKADEKDLNATIDRDNWTLEQWEKECYKAKLERDEMKTLRADQLLAIAEAIKMLSSDETRELWKKVYPEDEVTNMPVTEPDVTTQPVSFLQMQITNKVRRQALAALRAGTKVGKQADPRLNLIEVALKGGKVGLDRIITNIDEVLSDLAADNEADLTKTENCLSDLSNAVADVRKAQKIIKKYTWEAKTKAAEIKDTAMGIAELRDKIVKLGAMVAESARINELTRLQYLADTSSNAAGKKVLKMVKNKLEMAFDPKAALDAPMAWDHDENTLRFTTTTTEAPMTTEAPIDGGAASLLQVQAEQRHRHRVHHPATGVITVIQKLIDDLTEEMSLAKKTEDHRQLTYENMAEDASYQIEEATKECDRKERELVAAREKLAEYEQMINDANEDLERYSELLADRRAECDVHLQYRRVRFEARRIEMQALDNAKKVLQGVDKDDIHESDKETNVFLPR